jgi:parallel beta-helix repeat protein
MALRVFDGDAADMDNSNNIQQNKVGLLNETNLNLSTWDIGGSTWDGDGLTPNDKEELAYAVSNGVPLSLYYYPKDTDLRIGSGKWTLQQLHEKFPSTIQLLASGVPGENNAFLIKKTVVFDSGAELDIKNTKVFLESLPNKDNIPATIITFGKTSIIDSTVSSWDPLTNAPDSNPYHPRSLLVAIDGGKMDINNSTISNMGFSQGGVHTLHSSLAAINYINTSDFTISNSNISHNLYGFYSQNASNFKIVDNNIYSNVGYGLDPHSGSKNFIIDSNNVRYNGLQGIICSHQCSNVTITNNIVEYNVEGIGLHWSTDFSAIKNNIIKYNKNSGVFLLNNSSNNIVENNTIIGNGKGIIIADNSINNGIRLNTLEGNIRDQQGISFDDNSRSNVIENNRISPSCNRDLLGTNICDQVL